MRRIPTLLEKLQELAEQGKDITVLDVDLMLDYTRVLYADLLEIRKVIPAANHNNEDDNDDDIVVPEEKKQISTTGVSENYADIPDVDIRTHIGINDKYLYISELFDNDKSAYDEAVMKLNTFSSEEEAINYVKSNLHSKYSWSDDSETVQSFYALLTSCFSRI